MKKSVFIVLVMMFALTAFCSGKKDKILLPKPDLKSGKPLMQCVFQRRSSRSFSHRALPLQTVAEVLFVADGMTRKDGRKTVPTARNVRNQSVYAFMADGVYLYNSRKHSLERVLKGDHRGQCGRQAFHKTAPLVLVFVSNMKAVGDTKELQALYAGNHSGSASQNVYLYAASKGLSTVVCGLLDRKKLEALLKLPASHKVIFSQPVGFPGE